MCCIFTWMAWCFDASHRVVVFIMACLISSSICCLLLVGSLAGVAMGYNYSLAEYIDLKETNISVYIKRGVYDDEIADDFDWRRSGKESEVFVKNTGLRSGKEDKQPLARRQDSIFESESENKYEGSLMRLTSTPNQLTFSIPEPPYTTPKTTTNVVDNLLAVADRLPGGSLDRLKAIQAAARYHEAQKVELATAKLPDDASGRIKAIEANAEIHARRSDPTTTDKYAKYFSQLAMYPGLPGSGLAARKFLQSQGEDLQGRKSFERQNVESSSPSRFRDAVFRGQLAGWSTAAGKSSDGNFFEYEMSPEPFLPLPAAESVFQSQPPRALWQTEPQRRPTKDREDKSKYEEAQKIDYDDSQGLPSRKKRSNRLNTKLKLLDYSDITLFTHKKQQQTEALDAEFDKSDHNNDTDDDNGDLNADDGITNEIDQSAKPEPDRPKNIENSENKNILRSLDGADDDVNNSIIKELLREYLERLLSFGKMERKLKTNPRKRKKRAKGYEYKKRGNKEIKSIWWRILDGAQQYWYSMIVYADKLILPMTDMTGLDNNYKTVKKNYDLNSSDRKQSAFINKFLSQIRN